MYSDILDKSPRAGRRSQEKTEINSWRLGKDHIKISIVTLQDLNLTWGNFEVFEGEFCSLVQTEKHEILSSISLTPTISPQTDFSMCQEA